MGVPAINPRAGVSEFHYEYMPGKTIRTYRDGSPSVETNWQHQVITGYSERSAVVKTSRVQLAPGTLWRPPAPFRRRIVRVTHNPGSMSAYGIHEVDNYTHFVLGTEALLYTINGLWGGAMSFPFYDPNNRNRSRAEALKKLGDQKVNYLVALAEARKTYNMLAGSTMQLIKALRHVSNKSWRAAAKELGINPRLMRNGRPMASRHLEFQYGWLPLMSDIHGTAKLLKQQLNLPLIMKATKHVITNGTVSSPNQIGGYQPGEHVFSAANGTVRIDDSTTVWGRLDSPYLRLAQEMGLTNPLTLAWELIPYSFVVDWALPVGTMLDALSATNGVKFVGGYEAFHGQMKLTVTGKVPFSSGGTPGSATYESFFYDRAPLSGWPTVLPYVKSPFSAMHAANALALLRGRFR